MGGDVVGQVGDGKMARGLTSLGSFYRPEVPMSPPTYSDSVGIEAGL